MYRSNDKSRNHLSTTDYPNGHISIICDIYCGKRPLDARTPGSPALWLEPATFPPLSHRRWTTTRSSCATTWLGGSQASDQGGLCITSSTGHCPVCKVDSVRAMSANVWEEFRVTNTVYSHLRLLPISKIYGSLILVNGVSSLKWTVLNPFRIDALKVKIVVTYLIDFKSWFINSIHLSEWDMAYNDTVSVSLLCFFALFYLWGTGHKQMTFLDQI